MKDVVPVWLASVQGKSFGMSSILKVGLGLWTLALVLLSGIPVGAESPPPPVAVRVGVLSFEDSDELLRQMKAQAGVLRSTAPPLLASFAVGTYGELFHWVENDMIDVAVVNPSLYARLPRTRWDYLGSAGGGDEVRSVWLARKEAHLSSLADLKAAGPSLQVLAVDPLSASGFLNPVSALQAAGLELRPEQIRFTYSHNNSLRCLSASTGKQVACVWKATWQRHPDAALVEVPIPGLDAFHSPPVALIGRHDAPSTRVLAALVQSGKFPGFSFDPHYDDSVRALPTSLPGPLQAFSGRPLDRVDLDDLVFTLHHYNRTHPDPARLALVLAGGGAKCSYQAGAVRALEERLQSAQQSLHDEQLKIRLVVGTSGGGINALAVAMGLTQTAEGFRDLRAAWNDLDQREIVCPPLAVRVNMWCWFASIAGLVLLVTARGLSLSHRSALTLTAVAGLILAILPRLPLRPWVFLGQNADLQHVWAWLSFGIEGAGLLLVAAALAGALAARRLSGMAVPLGRLLTAGVALLPLLQTWVIFCHEEVLSENFGLERALTRNFGKLVTQESVRRAGCSLPALSGMSIRGLSQELFSRKLLQRDLVLTASPLTDPSLQLPGELYFHASPLGSPPPDFGARGVPLSQRPELLLDALLGSAAIYPLFPARRIEDLPVPGKHVDLVDGSFAHRSPLEAAVAWKATHVLVIEASTEEVAPRGKFLDNLGAALSYLYDEAQSVDVRLKGQTVLYTLYPSIPHIGLLDFSSNIIDGSIDKGYREASGAPTSAYQRGGALRKALGPPLLWTP